MDLHAELARLNATPELPDWVAGTVQKLIDQAEKEAAESARQIARRDTDLHAAQTKIQALVLELVHLRRMRYGNAASTVIGNAVSMSFERPVSR
jgi:predicted RNase H-like nuclease